MEILKFKSANYVTEKLFTEAGFTKVGDNYHFQRYLYENLIRLNVKYIYVADKGYNLWYRVTNANNEDYLPFYNNDIHTNEVAKIVVHNFNKIMKSLVKQGVIADDITEEERRRINASKKIKIKYHDDELIRAEQKPGSDWIDLRAAEDVELKKGDFKLVSLGVSMSLPKGYEAHIVPRSSTFKNFGTIQVNSTAIIDNFFSGENDVWKYPVYATRDAVIHKNDRICQFRIVKNQPPIIFEEVDNLGGKSRGGFGSTGIQQEMCMVDIIAILPIIGLLLGIITLSLAIYLKNEDYDKMSSIEVFFGSWLVIYYSHFLLTEVNNTSLAYYCGLFIGIALVIYAFTFGKK